MFLTQAGIMDSCGLRNASHSCRLAGTEFQYVLETKFPTTVVENRINSMKYKVFHYTFKYQQHYFILLWETYVRHTLKEWQ